MLDEKAEKESFGFMGAGGVRMCLSCINCVKMNKEKITAASGFVHFTESDMSKFKPNTKGLIDASLHELQVRKPLLKPTPFANLEKILGMRYDRCTLLLSPYKGMVDLPESRYTDWFHDLLASGGVFQYALNQIIFDIVHDTDISLVDIDVFQQSVNVKPNK